MNETVNALRLSLMLFCQYSTTNILPPTLKTK